ncbi:Hypothetical predicted protein, partial [Paramuricea clavata]
MVALQTVHGVLRGERVAKVRVLFDAGNHRSFVTSKAASLVNPKGLRRELLGINTFGQKCTNAEDRQVVELKLGPVNGNKVISLEAFVVPEICRIQNSHVELARREYPHLKGVTKRGKSGEPVAIETELGWVLSGPLRVQDIEGAELAQVNFVAQTLNNEDSLE